MKLIDLLVQELPKRGGWPGDNAPGFYSFLENNNITFEFDFDCAYFKNQHGDTVNRAQYETALAASQKVEWDGAGMPPVGCEFEYGTHHTKAKCLAIGHHMVFASKGNLDDEEGDYEEFMIDAQIEFHPIRSESERKRDETLCAMRNCVSNFNNTSVIHAIEQCYDAIAAGKIPGVRIE